MRKRLLYLAPLGAVLASCSVSANYKPATSQAPHISNAVTPSTTSASSTTTPPVSPSTTSRCRSGEVKITAGKGDAAMGYLVRVFAIENISPDLCTLEGFPGIQMLAQDGTKLATEVSWGSSVSVLSEPVTLVSIAPSASAYFYMGYANQTGYAMDTCPTSASVQVIIPNAYNPVQVTVALNPYGGTVQNLKCGMITVSPVVSQVSSGYGS